MRAWRKPNREKRMTCVCVHVCMNGLLECSKLYKLNGRNKLAATDTAKRHTQTHIQMNRIQALPLCLICEGTFYWQAITWCAKAIVAFVKRNAQLMEIRHGFAFISFNGCFCCLPSKHKDTSKRTNEQTWNIDTTNIIWLHGGNAKTRGNISSCRGMFYLHCCRCSYSQAINKRLIENRCCKG